MTGLDHRHSDRTIITDYNYRNGLLLSLTHIIYTVCQRVQTWNMYSCIRMLSQYKTHVGLEVQVCFGSNQDANNVIMIVLTGNIQSSGSILYKQSQGEEQNEQVNTNKHHILHQLSNLCVHQCTESGVHQLPVVNSRCSLYKQQS